MTAELICVGTELLLGNIVNTNGAYIAQKCADLGLSMYYQSVVGDNMRRLCKCFRAAMKRSDVVILCGGLGPHPGRPYQRGSSQSPEAGTGRG